MTTQQDGDRHDRLIYLTTPIAPAICGGLAWWANAAPPAIAPLILGSIAAHIFGGLYLSPDLDLSGMMHCKAWWRWERAKLGWVWAHYPRIAGCHRSARSHAPVLGTATRLAYLMAIAPLTIPVMAKHWRRTITLAALTAIAMNHTPWWALVGSLVVGVETSAIAHYAQDGTVFGGHHKPRPKRQRRHHPAHRHPSTPRKAH